MQSRLILLLAVVLVVGCRDVGVPAPAPNPDSTSVQDSALVADGDCARSLCGCWVDSMLTYQNRIVDEVSGTPLRGIALTCVGESEPIAVSGLEGSVAFELQTRFSPGCKFERCRNLRFEDPSGAYEPAERTVFQLEAIEMERIREE